MTIRGRISFPAVAGIVRRILTPSTRWRIVGWVTLTAGVAIATIIFSVYQVMRRDLIEKVNTEISQELSELRTFAQEGKNPRTSEAFSSPAEMLEVYISRQYPGEHEQQLGIVRDKVLYLSEEEISEQWGGYRLHEDQQMLHRISTSPQNSGVEQTPHGTFHWGRIDIGTGESGQDRDGQFVVVKYVTPSMDDLHRTMTTVCGIAFLALLLAFGIAWFVAGQILKPIRSLRQVAEAVSDKNFTGRVPVVGRDDIAAMSLTFNQMLDRLEESATTQRRFLDDVSHELRTPITIVRGHLELMERSTQEQAATLELVDDELDRMGRIVADLLLLAKSERPDFIRAKPADPGRSHDQPRIKGSGFSRQPMAGYGDRRR